MNKMRAYLKTLVVASWFLLIAGQVHAIFCLQNPGEFTPVNPGDFVEDAVITALHAFECKGGRCFILYGDAEGLNKVFEVGLDGELERVPDDFLTRGEQIIKFSSIECERHCIFFALTKTLDNNPQFFLRAFTPLGPQVLPLFDFELDAQPRDLATFQCNGTCYIMIAGESEGYGANKLYTYSAVTDELTFLEDYDTEHDLYSIESFFCEGRCFIATGGVDDNLSPFSNLYKIDICTEYPSDRLVQVQQDFVRDFTNNTLTPLVMTAFECNCRWYIAAVSKNVENDTTPWLQTFVLNPETALFERVGDDILYPADIGLMIDDESFFLAIASYECDCGCYVVVGADAFLQNDSSLNSVYEVLGNGRLSLVQSGYNDGLVGALTAYDCCGCHVISGGNPQGGDIPTANFVYGVGQLRAEAHNNCFLFEQATGSYELSIFENDCGCLELETTTFYRDRELTDLIGGPGDFSNQEIDTYKLDKGTLSWDQAYAVLTYMTPAIVPPEGPVVFYYQIGDCCNCQDAAQVTIFISEPASPTDFDVEIGVPCDAGYGSVAAATVTNPGIATFTFTWLDDADYVLSSESGVTTSNSPTLFAPNTYKVQISGEGIIDCTLEYIFTVETCACDDCDLDVTVELTCETPYMSDGSITVTVNGGGVGPQYTISVDGDTRTDVDPGSPEIFSDLIAGMYTITVSDQGNAQCESLINVTLEECPIDGCTTDLLVRVESSCENPGKTNGQIDVTVESGGIGPFTITVDYDTRTNVSQGQTESFFGLAAGTYTVTILDQCNTECMTMFDVEVDECPQACGKCNVIVTVNKAK